MLGRNQRLLLEALIDGKELSPISTGWSRTKIRTTLNSLEMHGLVERVATENGNVFVITQAGRQIVLGNGCLSRSIENNNESEMAAPDGMVPPLPSEG